MEERKGKEEGRKRKKTSISGTNPNKLFSFSFFFEKSRKEEGERKASMVNIRSVVCPINPNIPYIVNKVLI